MNPNHSTISSNAVKPYVTTLLKDLLTELFKSQKEEDLFMEFFAGQKEIISEFKRGKNEKIIRSIKSFIAEAKNRREKLLDDYISSSYGSSSELLRTGGKLGQQLIENSKDLLFQLKNSNGKDHTSTTMIYESVMEELNYCGVLPFNAMMDKLNNASDSNARSIVESLSTSDFDHIISMTENAVEQFGDVHTTVLDTLKQNIDGYTNAKNQLNSGSGGDGCGAILGNWIGRIIIAIIVISILRNC